MWEVLSQSHRRSSLCPLDLGSSWSSRAGLSLQGMLEMGAVTQLEGLFSISPSSSDPWRAVVCVRPDPFVTEFRQLKRLLSFSTAVAHF